MGNRRGKGKKEYGKEKKRTEFRKKRRQREIRKKGMRNSSREKWKKTPYHNRTLICNALFLSIVWACCVYVVIDMFLPRNSCSWNTKRVLFLVVVEYWILTTNLFFFYIFLWKFWNDENAFFNYKFYLHTIYRTLVTVKFQ